MDKKRLVKTLPPEDLKGFEEFIDGQSGDTNFLPKPAGSKKENSFEHFTFLTNDAERLTRLKNLTFEKLPFSARFDQGEALIKMQKGEIKALRERLFKISDEVGSTYRKSIGEVFNFFFEPPKP